VVTNFDQIQNWVNAHLSWTCEGNTHLRVFAVPPEWSKVFYGRPIAQAYAHVTPEEPTPLSGMVRVWVSVRVTSTREHNILFQGPWEAPNKAQRRLTRLLGNLNAPYIPPRDDLLSIANNSGCTVEV